MYRLALIATLAAAAVAPPFQALGAQQGGGRENDDIPSAYRPPAGMCRIWIEGVPPAQQPAPTDCTTAVRNRPANGRVVFGENASKDRGRNPLAGWKRGGDVDPKKLNHGDSEGGRSGERGEGRGDSDGGTPVSHPSQPFPEMTAAVQFAAGQRPADVARWLGEQKVTARFTDADRDGRPEHVTWVDPSGQLVQIWSDRDRDGRADRVQMFNNGRRVRVYE